MDRVSIQMKFNKNSPDYVLLTIVTLLVVFGLVMVYDSSILQAQKDFHDSYFYIRQQIIWVVLGVVIGTFFSFLDYHYLKKIALPGLVISFLAMLAVFIPGLGTSGGGAHRWLSLGFITIQPAEIIKLTTIIYFSAIFEKKIRTLPFLGIVAAVTFITAVLQKDLGSSIVYITICLIIYFVSNGSIKFLSGIILIGTATIGALITFSAYRSKRILAFLDPFSDSQGFSYHISQVLIALGSGGLFGVGLGQSRQKFEYIPEVSTDSIFAIIGEELGFVGATTLIILFGALTVRGIKIAFEQSDDFGRMLSVGIISWIGVQTIMNLSSMVALLPLTGVPLPFISYGGSAIVANLSAIGILLNISKKRI